jgi:hypothetical protein
MKNQVQALPENTATAPQSNSVNAPQPATPADLFPGSSNREAVAELKALAFTPDCERPSEAELIQFAEIFRHCTEDEDKRYGCATSNLHGFYDLIRDNPRIRPLTDALGAMCAADDYLQKVTGLIRKI